MSPEGPLRAAAIVCVLDSTWGLKPVLSQSWGGRAHSRGGPWGTVLPAHLAKDNVCVQPRTPRCLGNPTSQKPQMDRGEVLIRDLVFSSAQRVPGLWGHTLKAMLPAHVCVCVHLQPRDTFVLKHSQVGPLAHIYPLTQRARVAPHPRSTAAHRWVEYEQGCGYQLGQPGPELPRSRCQGLDPAPVQSGLATAPDGTFLGSSLCLWALTCPLRSSSDLRA